MKPSIQLIEALRRAATRIEDPNGGFDWMASEHCNCGILAQELGVEAHRLENIGLWTHLVENHCTVTGIPLNDVLQELHDAGILPSDIEGIEACNRPNVLARIGLDAPAKPYGIIDTYHRRNDQSKLKAIVASYFRAQAEILEEELTNLRQRISGDPEQVTPRGGSSVAHPSPEPSRPLPQSPSQPVACVHMWLECGVCMICSATKPVERKELA